jgi:ABC-type polysaccharide/polyol phosphate transport system ATPase subunit
MFDPVITVENLSKRYLVGHHSARRKHDAALRDVIVREAGNFARKAVDLVRSRQIVQGDEVEEFWALKDVSFEVKQGEVFGIIGRNGAGKSTLLKILSCITEPTVGRAVLRGRVASLLEVGTGFHPELTGRENIYLNGAILGMTRIEIRKKFDEIVAFSGVEKFLDTPVKQYSSGMYVRLAFAVAAHLEPEILIVDEVLAVGDAEFQKKCLGKMNEIALQDKRTVLVVSHNLDMINRLCNRAILLNQGSITSFGDTASVVECYLSKQNQPLRASWVRPKSQPASNHACLIAIDIIDENETPKSTFLFGQGFRIKIKLRNQTGSPLTCFIGAEILTENDFSLFTTNSNDKRQMDTLPVGDSVIECNFNPNLLLPGKYSVRAGLVDGVLTVLDVVDPDLYIEISNVAFRNYPISTRRPGRIVVPLDWSELRSVAVGSP